ncbi:hypothetical protein EYR36_010215 [Pleurotus pulmonarius]|nr:hypothetical protein EYR36_010215 [Pleurotus pulmonarius]KAF4586397.1 hypothetical protein EYR38_010673 [Pleurotus pulmonarius]
MSPRPILKRTPSAAIHHDHHAVHFPPSPSLTRTFEAHCPSTYDRSPIVVLPNSCALPERGCPGRTYAAVDSSTSASPPRSRQYAGPSPPTRTPMYAPKDLHPRALSRQHDLRDRDSSCSTPMGPFSLPPPLIPDLSSESEESDGFVSPPEPNLFSPSSPRSSHRSPNYNTKHTQHPSSPYDRYAPTVPSIPQPSAFYAPPSTPTHPPHLAPHPHHSPEETQVQIARRRRDRERKRERSRERDRVRGVLVDEDEEFDAGVCSTPRVRSSSCYKTITTAFSGFNISEADSSCLDGF